MTHDTKEGPLFVKFPKHDTACVLDDAHASLCGQSLENTEEGAARVLDPTERMRVCSFCALVAEDRRLAIPKMTGF